MASLKLLTPITLIDSLLILSLFLKGIIAYSNPIFSASLTNLSIEFIGLISPVKPTSPIIATLGKDIPLFFTLDNKANAKMFLEDTNLNQL